MSEFKNKILYKKDSKGKVRVWWMETNYDKDSHRTCSGLEFGKLVCTNWTVCKPKNVGKSNETTAVEQASAEIDAKYNINLERGYAWTVKELETIEIFKPMLARKYEDFITKKVKLNFGPTIFSQPKLDGIRCIARFKNGVVSLWTRTGKPITSCEHIKQNIFWAFAGNEDYVFDGELYNHDLKNDFNKITSLVRKEKPNESEKKEIEDKVQYHIYDLYDKSRPEIPFLLRSMQLNHIFSNFANDYDGSLKNVSTTGITITDPKDLSQIDKLYESYLDDGYEGQMVRANTQYSNSRSWGLLKRKEFTDAEFIVTDIIEGKGNWAGYAKSVQYKMMSTTKEHVPDPRLRILTEGEPTIFDAGLAGDQNFCKELLKNKERYIGGQVTVTYFQPTPDGMPRFPVAKKFYKKGKPRDD